MGGEGVQDLSAVIRLPRRRPLRIATLVAIVVLFVIVATGILGVLFPAKAAASSSSLEVLDGIVAVSHDGAVFAEGHDGDLLQQGDIVRTGSDSHAVMTFYDGSTIEVEPDSEIVVETLEATASGDILMALRQDFGRTWHVVSRSLSADSKYEVRTPGATATVRGTAFEVDVDPAGRTHIQTTDGTVGANAGGVEVPVPAGFATDVPAVGAAPDPATPAPAPNSVVRIVLDPTPNAVVVDPNGRTVGLLNGLPIRYAPGSTVQVVDGRLVITIPNPPLGRIDTHVQPARGTDTSVDVNIQVIVNGATVGNVVEHRSIDGSGVAKGGVVVTSTGTFVLPDSDAQDARTPRVGRIPPPPPGGLFGGGARTPAPTAIVPTADPSFVPRFSFDPRLVARTATPPPPSPSPAPTFAGGFQPYVTTDRTLSTATPAPNSGLTVYTASSPAPVELTRLSSPTPTPAPTLNTRLTAPILLVTPTPTPAPTLLILRTFDTSTDLRIAPTATPTASILLAPLPLDSPAILFTSPPTATPPPVILVTQRPIASAIILLPTPTPTPAPSFIPIFSLPPIVITSAPTVAPTPAPTLAPIVTAPIRIATLPPATTPPPPPTVLRSFTPRCIVGVTC